MGFEAESRWERWSPEPGHLMGSSETKEAMRDRKAGGE